MTTFLNHLPSLIFKILGIRKIYDGNFFQVHFLKHGFLIMGIFSISLSVSLINDIVTFLGYLKQKPSL